jgi:uncharacterized protein (TIGR02594 family)
MTLPKLYAWLADEGAPRLLVEMLKLYGTVEKPGKGDNPLILEWANHIGLGHVYRADSVAWCGLTIAYACAQAGYPYAPKGNALWARNWATWGDPVSKTGAMLGDVLVFARGNAGHVALYVGEDTTHFHILGGNQDDQVSIKRRAKAQLLAVRRCHWNINQPPNVRKVMLAATGSVAKSEA